MIIFALGATVLVVTALFFILPTLLRDTDGNSSEIRSNDVNLRVLRDQLHELDADLAAGTLHATTYASARQELERRVAEDVKPFSAGTGNTLRQNRTAILIGLGIPALAMCLYFLVGTPAGLDPAKVAAVDDKSHEVTDAQIIDMVGKLAERLKSRPDDVEGWHMLARAYSTMGRFDDAVNTYSHLVSIAPGSADFFADYADVLAMKLNRTLQGEPEKLIRRALLIDPDNIKALALAGSADFEKHDYHGAITIWKKILLLTPPDSAMTHSVITSIGEAQKLAGDAVTPPQALLPAVPSVAASPSVTQTNSAGSQAVVAKIAVYVELDPALRGKVADSDAVFIFARAAEGPKFPLAVLRRQVKDLPARFVLDDTMSVMDGAKLSAYPRLIVGARVSKSGNATPQAGDLEGLSSAVALDTQGLKISINTVRN